MIDTTIINRKSIDNKVYSLIAVKDETRTLYYELGVIENGAMDESKIQRFNSADDAVSAFDSATENKPFGKAKPFGTRKSTKRQRSFKPNDKIENKRTGEIGWVGFVGFQVLFMVGGAIWPISSCRKAR